MSRRFWIVNELASNFLSRVKEDDIEVELLEKDDDALIRAVLEVMASCTARNIQEIKDIVDNRYGCCIGLKTIKSIALILRAKKLLVSEDPYCLAVTPSEIDIEDIKDNL